MWRRDTFDMIRRLGSGTVDRRWCMGMRTSGMIRELRSRTIGRRKCLAHTSFSCPVQQQRAHPTAETSLAGTSITEFLLGTHFSRPTLQQLASTQPSPSIAERATVRESTQSPQPSKDEPGKSIIRASDGSKGITIGSKVVRSEVIEAGSKSPKLDLRSTTVNYQI
ncbi:hypothetical protein Drorol1_Dr00001482 [Drosera rotundifolia]